MNDYEKKARELVKKMTLDEKIGMIHGDGLFVTKGVPRLGIPPFVFSDGPCGVRQDFAKKEWKAASYTKDRVSYLPCNSAVAATWNRSLAKKTGKVLGEEARGRGKDMILAPGVNIKRSPLCGRNFEYFSEDPYLTGELASSLIDGIQRNDVAACVKHFAVNNQETDRWDVDTIVDRQTLDEIYFPPFRKAVDRGADAVMGAYNLLNSEHCCHSHFLLDEVLRGEWSFDGTVVSDWGGVRNTEEAALTSVDVEMSVYNNFDDYYMASPMKKLVQDGRIREQEIDKKVIHILVMMQKLHMLPGQKRKAGNYDTVSHQKKLLRTAEESIVLLKNKNDVLPLDINPGEKILLIGENADRTHAPRGGSAEIKALYEITPLLGLSAGLGGNNQVDYLPGYISGTDEAAQEAAWQAFSLGGDAASRQGIMTSDDIERINEKLCEEAMRVAPQYDHVIFIGGLNHAEDQEGHDRKDMSLPYGQPELISKLLTVCPGMIVVLIGGNPVEMDPWVDDAKALIWMYYNGMEGGKALAEVLTGKVNPSGHLPVTFYKKLSDCSAHRIGEFGKKGRVEYKERDLVGYRYLLEEGIEPQFPFGYGLSYTSFQISDITRSGNTVTFSVANTGERDGSCVIQIYRDHPGRKYHQLCGFTKVKVPAGGHIQAEITAEAPDIAELYIGEDCVRCSKID